MEEQILYKHHIAAHAGVSFSLIERKVLNVLLYNAFSKLAHQEEYKIEIGNIIHFLGVKTRNYSQIYSAIKKIACTLVEWGVLKPQTLEGDLTGVTFLEMFNIKNGLITYRLPRELRNILFEPDRYTKIKMSSVASLKSSYGVALYENCSSYSGFGTTGWISVDDFKKLMGIEDQYRQYRDLNNRVIKPALNDVNKHSEFDIKLSSRKEGRKVVYLKFDVKKKKEATLPSDIKPSTEKVASKAEKSTFDILTHCGVSKDKAKQWVEQYSDEYLLDKINYVSQYKNARSKVGLLIKAIETDYRVNSEATKKSLSVDDRRALEDEYKQYIKHEIINWIERLSEEQWESYCRTIILYVDSPVVKMELEERLKDKSFYNFNNTLDDLIDYTYRLFVSCKAELANLRPPTIKNWKEYLAEKCPPPT